MRVTLFCVAGVAIVEALAGIAVLVCGGIPALYEPFERQDVRLFAAKEERLNGTLIVRVSGSILSSLYTVKGYSVDSRTSTVRLTVYIGIYGPRLPFAAKDTIESANFDVAIPINGAAQRIAFGKKGVIIWTRGAKR